MTTQSAHAQGGPTTAAGDQKSVTSKSPHDEDGVLSDGTPVKARVQLNPSLFTVGIKFHLPFGPGH